MARSKRRGGRRQALLQVEAERLLGQRLWAASTRVESATPERVAQLRCVALTRKKNGRRGLVLLKPNRQPEVLKSGCGKSVKKSGRVICGGLCVLDVEICVENGEEIAYVFDALVVDGVDVRGLTLVERADLGFRVRCLSWLRPKPYLVVSEASDASACLRELMDPPDENADGIVLLDACAAYGTSPVKFKETVSCDFQLEAISGVADGFSLLVLRDGYLSPFAEMSLAGRDMVALGLRRFPPIRRRDRIILECAPSGEGWIPMRLREDRGRPNSLSVVESNAAVVRAGFNRRTALLGALGAWSARDAFSAHLAACRRAVLLTALSALVHLPGSSDGIRVALEVGPRDGRHLALTYEGVSRLRIKLLEPRTEYASSLKVASEMLDDANVVPSNNAFGRVDHGELACDIALLFFVGHRKDSNLDAVISCLSRAGARCIAGLMWNTREEDFASLDGLHRLGREGARALLEDFPEGGLDGAQVGRSMLTYGYRFSRPTPNFPPARWELGVANSDAQTLRGSLVPFVFLNDGPTDAEDSPAAEVPAGAEDEEDDELLPDYGSADDFDL